MSTENLSILFICGFLAFAALFFFAIGAIMVFLFTWATRRTGRILSDAHEALQIETDEYFADVVPKLQPWRSEALADFSSLWQTVGLSALGSIHYRGTIKSLGQPEETGWLAYELRVKRLKGPLVLRTSARTRQLDIHGSSAQVTVEGQPLGRLHTHRREVTLFDPNDQPIGQYQRQLRPLWIMVGVWQSGYFDPAYGPVELGGRPVAELNNNLIHGRYLARLKQPMPAFLRNLAPDLTPEEEDWLLALVGLEIYFRVIRGIRERRR